MVSDVGIALISGGIGILGGIIGSLVTNYFNQERLKSEHREWYSRERFKEKSIALKEMNTSMVACKDALNYYGNFPPTSSNEFGDEVSDPVEAFTRLKAKSSIWFDSETEKIFSELMGVFREARVCIGLMISDGSPGPNENAIINRKNFPWKCLNENYSAARAEIRRLLAK
jgi:hypothetical protein